MKNKLFAIISCLLSVLITYLILQNRHDTKINKIALAFNVEKTSIKRQELMEAWKASQKFTLNIVGQMPNDYFGFKYTPEAMTFAEQWRHCAIFTCNQLAGRFDLKDNPYQDKSKRPAVELNKTEVIIELNKMYDYVFETILNLPENQLYTSIDFAGDSIPGWRLFYAMENHIIHHRGQCIVYLRLKGVIPIGYIGW